MNPTNANLFDSSTVLKVDEALDYFFEIEKVKELKQPDFDELYEDFIEDAIKYANIRSTWHSLSIEDRNEKDAIRTSCHNAFIADCDIIARIMANNELDKSWREAIGDDRKRIGDFACWIASVIAIRAR